MNETTTWIPQSADTSIAAERVVMDGLREMSPLQKLELIAGACRDVQMWALMGLRMRYPDATDREVKLRLASFRLSRETMIAVFGWDPDEMGR